MITSLTSYILGNVSLHRKHKHLESDSEINIKSSKKEADNNIQEEVASSCINQDSTGLTATTDENIVQPIQSVPTPSSLPNSEKHFSFNVDLSKRLQLNSLIKKIKHKKIYPDIIVNNLGGSLGYYNGNIRDNQKVEFSVVVCSIQIDISPWPAICREQLEQVS